MDVQDYYNTNTSGNAFTPLAWRNDTQPVHWHRSNQVLTDFYKNTNHYPQAP